MRVKPLTAAEKRSRPKKQNHATKRITQQRSQVLRTAGRWASDSRLSFTWSDAAKLSRIVRSHT